jgi:UMF1 family MFS transporter
MTTDGPGGEAAPRPSRLRALGLHRRELRAWALYDWANSAFATTMMAGVLPVFYSKVAAATLPDNVRTAYWGYTQTAALLVIAAISPVLGAFADYLGAKKRFLAFFALLGVTGSLAQAATGEGDWLFASAMYVVGNIGFGAGNVFYESLLPHIADAGEVDRVSTAGYAMGYVGGGLLLALNLAWIMTPATFGLADAGQGTRLSFISVGLWWGLFTLPLMRRVAEPPRPPAVPGLNLLAVGFSRLAQTFRDVRRHRQTFVFLLAFWFYNDGINTIIKMATIYGTEIGIGQAHLIGALLLVQFLGIPCTFLYGALAGRIGAKRGIYLALLVYTGISLLGYFMARPWHFWALACAVALVQGGSQALSRSLYATLIPAARSSEFFGFYSISGKFGNIIGPLVFAAVSQATGGSRLSIVALVLFFVGGMLLLRSVDVDAGRRAALEAL